MNMIWRLGAGFKHFTRKPILDRPTVPGCHVGPQTADAHEGLVGFSALSRPWQKQYATRSVWTSDQALTAFAGIKPHRQLMSDLAPEMGPTKFVRWTIKGSGGRPTWNDPLGRLA
jgi:hypothetical protein